MFPMIPSRFAQTTLGAAIVVAAALALPAQAQNVAIVNGKPVPKARVEALMAQATSQGQPVTPELESQVRDEVVDATELAGDALFGGGPGGVGGIGAAKQFGREADDVQRNLQVVDDGAGKLAE